MEKGGDCHDVERSSALLIRHYNGQGQKKGDWLGVRVRGAGGGDIGKEGLKGEAGFRKPVVGWFCEAEVV